MLQKIKKIIQTNWIKTIVFNFHYFGLKGLKPKCLLAYHVKLDKLGGKIILQDDTKLQIGYFENYAEEGYHKHFKFYNDGLIQVGGRITLSKGMSVFVDKNSNFIIGNNVHIGPNTAIDCHSTIKIGDNSMVAWNCTIMNRDGHDIIDLNSSTVLNPIDSVFIGEHCWICQNAIILKGSNIPDHSVVAARSTVTKKLEKTNCIYVDNKIVREDIDIKF